MDEPFLLMIAGPNGSGKTTLTRWLQARDIEFGEYINPDDIAASLAGSYEQRTVDAQRIADERREQYLKERRSFTFETVMSHQSKIDILVRAKEAGFKVQLFFVGTDDPLTNIERVALRVKQGGHDVPVGKIVSRWKRSMEFLSDAIRSSDDAFIFDNSVAGLIETTPRLIFRRKFMQERKLPRSEQFPPIPEWVTHYVLQPLGIRFGRYVRQEPMRSIISVAEENAAPARAAGSSAETRIDSRNDVRDSIAPAVDAQPPGGLRRITGALSNALDMAATAYVKAEQTSGLPTGLKDLDLRMGGLQSSDLIVIGSRPSMGKTALATNIAHYLARTWKGQTQPDGHIQTISGGVVGFFSLAMSAEQLAMRVIAERTGISTHHIHRGSISEQDFQLIAEAATELQAIPLYIDDTGGLSLDQIAARAHRLKSDHGLDVLIIDDIQLLLDSMRRQQSRSSKSGEVTARLKSLAKELAIPIIALSQLPLSIDRRPDKRPQLTDLHELRSVEQDADVILFIYREDHYLLAQEPLAGTEAHLHWQTEVEMAYGRASLIIAKHRHGPTGTVQVLFDQSIGRFSDLAVT